MSNSNIFGALILVLNTFYSVRTDKFMYLEAVNVTFNDTDIYYDNYNKTNQTKIRQFIIGGSTSTAMNEAISPFQNVFFLKIPSLGYLAVWQLLLIFIVAWVILVTAFVFLIKLIRFLRKFKRTNSSNVNDKDEMKPLKPNASGKDSIILIDDPAAVYLPTTVKT